jgi:DNA-binding NtrC family response regulator
MEPVVANRILIVEDEVDIRDILIEILESQNFIVIAKANGQEALDHLTDDNSISLIISDINMPVMDGVQLLSKLRVNGIHIPFLYLTAYGDRQRILSALRLGAVDFIDKPFTREVLLSSVTKFMDISRREREIRQLSKIEGTDKQVHMQEKMIGLLKTANYVRTGNQE